MALEVVYQHDHDSHIENCITYDEYQRTHDIFDRVYKHYGLDKAKVKMPFHYRVYEWLTQICSIVTGNFTVWNSDRSSQYVMRIHNRCCETAGKKEFLSLWNDILDVIEKHMDEIYKTEPRQDDWYRANY